LPYSHLLPLKGVCSAEFPSSGGNVFTFSLSPSNNDNNFGSPSGSGDVLVFHGSVAVAIGKRHEGHCVPVNQKGLMILETADEGGEFDEQRKMPYEFSSPCFWL